MGTTASFDYIVEWTLEAKASHGQLIEVNLEETPLTPYATECIRKPVAEYLPVLVDRPVGKSN